MTENAHVPFMQSVIIPAKSNVLLETACLTLSFPMSQFSAPHTPALFLPSPTTAMQGKSWKRDKEGSKECHDTLHVRHISYVHTWLPCEFHKKFCFCPSSALVQNWSRQNKKQFLANGSYTFISQYQLIRLYQC